MKTCVHREDKPKPENLKICTPFWSEEKKNEMAIYILARFQIKCTSIKRVSCGND